VEKTDKSKTFLQPDNRLTRSAHAPHGQARNHRWHKLSIDTSRRPPRISRRPSEISGVGAGDSNPAS
jgi:hypothetical protein